MSFQDIPNIEKPDFYLDLAFKNANNRASLMRDKKFPNRFVKSKTLEIEKIKTVGGLLRKSLAKIVDSFPSMDQLPDFYKELIKNSLDYGDLKKSLGAVNWAVKKVEEFTNKYSQKLKKCQEMDKLNAYRREYYGRISSVPKQIRQNLKIIENARRIFRDFPVVKTGMKTVCICGFPNVGKTTLLSKLTGSKPEISNYSFTTKSLNVGYITYNARKLQLIDTPGTLNRFEKMNAIEKQAYLAVKHCADVIVYVFDLTEPYPLDDQLKLLNSLKLVKKDILLYVSKTDILDRKRVLEFSKKHPVMDSDGIKGVLLKVL